MSVKEVFNTLDVGRTKEQDGLTITFKEGKRLTDYIT